MTYASAPWSQAERDLFVKAWEEGGVVAARKALPHRSDDAFRNKVNELGLGGDSTERLARASATSGSIEMQARLELLFERFATKHKVTQRDAALLLLHPPFPGWRIAA